MTINGHLAYFHLVVIFDHLTANDHNMIDPASEHLTVTCT